MMGVSFIKDWRRYRSKIEKWQDFKQNTTEYDFSNYIEVEFVEEFIEEVADLAGYQE